LGERKEAPREKSKLETKKIAPVTEAKICRTVSNKMP